MNEPRVIDARISSIIFFSVLYLMLISIIVLLFEVDIPFKEQIPYMHLYLLTPVVLVKVFLPNSKLGKWLAKRVILYNFDK